MKSIPLDKGYVALVDDTDFDWLSQYNWSVHFTQTSGPYVRGYVEGKTVYMHRLLMGFPKSRVDHANGDGLDNQRFNLRSATASQNAANMKLSKANKSGVKGVYWHGKAGKWVAQIKVNNKVTALGFFDDISVAELAYRDAAAIHFGEFARPVKGEDHPNNLCESVGSMPTQ